MAIETKVVIGWFKRQLKMWLVDLNYNFEYDWFVELSDNNLASKFVTPTCKLWPRKQQLYERFTSTLFRIVWFVPKFYMILFYMFHTFYLSRFFPSVTLTKYVSSYRKI